LVAGALVAAACVAAPETPMIDTIRLPEARAKGSVSVETALHERRSLREFGSAPLSREELAQLLWAAQGVTRPGGHRTAPSAGALYPLEVYAVAGDVSELAAGVYRYLPAEHRLLRILEGDRRKAVASAALSQDWMRRAPAILLIAAVFERTERKYGDRATRYVPFEAGCAAQNVALQGAALGIGGVVVGAFADAELARAAGLPPGERPIALMPVGRE
jgi:SagB-type dehydrogenase family enzyme